MISFPNTTFSKIFSSNESNYTTKQYEVSRAVVKLHSVVRDGHTDDITFIRQGESGYFNGVLLVSVLLLMLFIGWGVALILFKQNPSRYGFLSGCKFSREYHSKNGRIVAMQERYLRPMFVRIVYLIFCGIIVLLSVLWTTKGAESISMTTSSLQGNTNEMAYLMKETIDTVDELLIVSSNISNVSSFLADIGPKANICPGGNMTELLGEDIDTQEISKQLNDIEEEILNQELLLSMKETLSKVHGSVMHVDSMMNRYNNGAASASSPNYNWKPLLVVSPYIICTALFVVGVLLVYMDASTQKYQGFLSYGVLPAFVTLVLLSTGLGIILRVVGTMNADTCYGSGTLSPDYTVKKILTSTGAMDSTMSADVITYVLEGCDNSMKNPLLFTDKYQTLLESSIVSLSHFSTVMGSMDINRLNDFCNKDLTPTILHFQILAQSLAHLYQLSLQSLSLYSCPNLSHLYTSTVYGTLCTYSPQAIRWTYQILMGLSVCGWVMITLRASYLENDNEPGKHNLDKSRRSGTPISSTRLHRNTPATDMALYPTPDDSLHGFSLGDSTHAIDFSIEPTKLDFDRKMSKPSFYQMQTADNQYDPNDLQNNGSANFFNHHYSDNDILHNEKRVNDQNRFVDI